MGKSWRDTITKEERREMIHRYTQNVEILYPKIARNHALALLEAADEADMLNEELKVNAAKLSGDKEKCRL